MTFENNIFTPEFFIKRIPFFVDYKLEENPYKENTNGLEHSIDFTWEQTILRPSVNIKGSNVTFSKVQAFSDFTFTPSHIRFKGRQIKDLIELHFNLWNQIHFTIPFNLPYEDEDKVRHFITENNRVCHLLSYSHQATGGGTMMMDGEGNFDEKELDIIINKINEKLFKFEDYMKNFSLTY